VSADHHKVDGKVWLQDAGTYTVLRLDVKTGKCGSGPRRGMIDAEGRVWFGENRSDRIGMFDTRTERFQEWNVPTTGSWPYDVTADKNGEAWSGNEFNDRIQRLDPKTGRIIEYLLPRFTNVRRVFVENKTNPVTFWIGNNHGASIVKLEPLDGPSAE
jgi:streptogramin lyase